MNYFMMGAPLFMGILTPVGVAMLVAFFLKKMRSSNLVYLPWLLEFSVK